ncbi:MAG: hypothetical protein OEZ48_17765, partial [Candidatus Bathyarchaeota archaeon]|nr:hypothetical protein [Candidatus Bathyarchaeota archaeon]
MHGSFLIDADAEQKGVTLHLYDTANDRTSEFADSSYKSYFLTRSPISAEEEKLVKELNARTSMIEKVDLFTGKVRKVIKVELDDPSNIERTAERFEQHWEASVPPALSYVYDRDLIFGGLYLMEDGGLKPVLDVPSDLMFGFEERFADVKRRDPSKYELILTYFKICSQSVPEVSLRRFGVEGTDRTKVYRSFMLSRITNLPLPFTYSSRHVSTWIRSM